MMAWTPRFCRNAVTAAVIVALFPVSIVFIFGDRLQGIDDLIFTNPIYMYLTTGHWSFPIHGELDRFIIHPPLHYLLIALWMKIGLSNYYANFITVYLLSCLAILAILKSTYAPFIKCVFLTAFALTSLLYFTASDVSVRDVSVRGVSIRSDFHMFVAWFLGTVLLADDNPTSRLWRPFVGSLVLAYAAALAWVSASALGGIGMYILLNIRNIKKPSVRACVIASIAGGLCFGVPYLIVYVIPNFHSIEAFLYYNSTAGLSVGSHSQFNIYHKLSEEKLTMYGGCCSRSSSFRCRFS